MNNLVFMVPRLALSGGNIITLAVARHLHARGVRVKVFDGRRLHSLDVVELASFRRGLWNTILNLSSFLGCSVFIRLFGGVATHHLTSIFGGADYAFIQDFELNFYPRHLRGVGAFFWRRYLGAKKRFFTNRYLAEALYEGVEDIGFSFDYVEFDSCLADRSFRDIDVLIVLREGAYKDPVRALLLHKQLLGLGIASILVNNTSQVLEGKGVVSGGGRQYFLGLLSRSKVFVCTSSWEGLGLPNIEAFLMGCNVVSTPIPSANLLIDHGGEVLILDERADDCIKVLSKVESWCVLSSLDEKGRENLIATGTARWWSYIDSIFS